MPQNIINILIFILYFILNTTYSQTISEYPEIIHSDFVNTPQAIKRLTEKQKLAIAFTHQRYTNILSDIYCTHFTGYLRLSKRHQIGLLANSLKEGAFIDKTRASLKYAYSAQIDKKTSVSLGISLGIFSIRQEEPNIALKMGTAPDGDFNILIYNSKYFVNYSLNQALTYKIKNALFPISLTKFHETRSGYNFKIKQNLELQLQIHSVLYSDRKNQHGAFLFLKKETFATLGIGSYNVSTLMIQGSVNFYKVNNYDFLALASYKQYLGQQQFNNYINSFEIGLRIIKKIDEDVHDTP